MMRTTYWAIAGLLIGVGAAHAQSARNLGGSLEIGWRAFTNQPSTRELAKFDEYTHTPSGLFLRFAEVNWWSGDSKDAFNLQAREAGERDQSYNAALQRLGLYQLDLGWSQLRHTFSTTARSLGNIDQQFSLPTPRPDTATWNQAPFIDPVRSLWEPAIFGLSVTPRPNLDFQAEYIRVSRSGSRPMGMAFGSPGSNFREILEPLEQTVHQLRLTQSVARPQYQLQLSYDFSAFRNDDQAVIADNPLVALDGATGSARGRTALAPDNLAHTISAAGGFNLPARTRVTASGSYGWRKQDEAFIPYTINSTLGSLAPGSTSLNGDVRIARLTVSGVTRPSSALTVRTRYSYFDLNDETPAAHFPGEVINDRTLVSEELSVHHRYPFEKHNASAEAGWRFGPLATLSAGYNWERWNRQAELRNVETTDEHAIRGVLDVWAFDAITVRTTVSRADRSGTGYQQVTTNQLPLLRRFDQADRIRDRLDVSAYVDLLEQVTLSGSYGRGRDDYHNSQYGLLDDESTVLSGTVDWAPWSRFSAYAGYVYEKFDGRQKSRYREPTVLDNTTFDWIASTQDEVRTAMAGFNAVILPDRLEAGARWEWSEASAAMHTRNPVAPANGTANQINSATAVDFPTIEQRFMPLSAFIRVYALRDWSAALHFRYEEFDDEEFRTDGLKPATGADIFLGNDYRDYRAGILEASIQYRLPSTGVPRLASRQASNR